MKNVKLKVNPEQNLMVQDKVKKMNEKEGRAWEVDLSNGYVIYHDGVSGSDRVVCVSRNWIGFEYLAIDNDGDLILCWNKEIFDKRPEKEVTFEEFMEKNERRKTKSNS